MSRASDETRAEVARRRLARLAADFHDQWPDPAAESGPTVEHERGGDAGPDLGRAMSAGSGLRGRWTPPVALGGLRVAHVRVVGALAVAGLVLGAWWVLAGRPSEVPAGGPVQVSAAGSDATAPVGGSPAGGAVPAGTPSEVVVDVVGAVARPGIVTLPAGSRVHEAVAAAGGVSGAVDTTTLNMARVLVDGEQIVVGSAVAGAATAPAGAAGAAGGPLSLSRATADDLDALPGVGPVTAAAIIAWRDENGPFRSVDDLLEVRGIGEATLDELRDLVTP